jgi:hypothetical protein
MEWDGMEWDNMIHITTQNDGMAQQNMAWHGMGQHDTHHNTA